ncbi:MAG: M12 family metallopeptidase [Planctomycetota bacterium]
MTHFRTILATVRPAFVLVVIALTIVDAVAQRSPDVSSIQGHVTPGCRVLAPAGGGGTHNVSLWPGGVVPYEFDSSVSGLNMNRTLDAMAELEAVSLVTFVPWESSLGDDRIRFFSASENSSFIGRIGGPQAVNILNWESRFTIVHEIMHALGIYHEHQRPDRDDFIQVNDANVIPEFAFNFAIETDAKTFGPYDFESVMHYGQCTLSNCGSTCPLNPNACRTITVLPPNQAQQTLIGQRDHLSPGDINTINALYDARLQPFPALELFEQPAISDTGWLIEGSTALVTQANVMPSPPFVVSIPRDSALASGVINAEDLGSLTCTFWMRKPNGQSSNALLVIERRDADLEWVEVDTISTGEIDGEAYVKRSITLGQDELHANLRLRFRVLGGVPTDAWTIDSIRLEGELPPPNDACQFGTLISPGDVVPFDTRGSDATPTVIGCASGDHDVWYRMVTMNAGELQLSVCDAIAPVSIALFTFICPTADTTPVLCATEGCGDGAALTFQTASTTLFWIRVSSASPVAATLVTDFVTAADTVGVCCLGAGNCTLTTADYCVDAGGLYQGDGTTCAQVICEPAVGACCFDDGTCADVIESGCINAGGAWTFFSSCDSLICPVEMGACCLSSSQCAMTSVDECAQIGGVYAGVGSNCLEAPCTLEPCQGDCAPLSVDGVIGNNVVNVDDLVAVITAFGMAISPTDVAPLNPDGTLGNQIVNVDDLITVINQFGPCE